MHPLPFLLLFPYNRLLIEAPRQCIIIGTTNSERYLCNSTGNRRFSPGEGRAVRSRARWRLRVASLAVSTHA